jgi:hypothetical protein
MDFSQPTRTELLAFVATLDPDVRAIFLHADQFVNETEETLSDSFQVAALVINVFEGYAISKRETT